MAVRKGFLCAVVAFLILGVARSSHASFAGPPPLEELVQEADVIVQGELIGVRRALERGYDEEAADLAFVRIDRIIRNRTSRPVACGEELVFRAVSTNYMSLFRWYPGKEAVWLITENSGDLQAVQHWHAQPAESFSEVEALCARLEAESAREYEGALERLRRQRAALAATPPYTLEQYEADLGKTVPADIPPEDILVAKPYFGGKVLIGPDGRVLAAQPKDAITFYYGCRSRFDRRKPGADAADIPGYDVSYLGDLSEGMCSFRVDGLWGFASADRKTIIPPQFTDVLSFSAGLAPVETHVWAFAPDSGTTPPLSAMRIMHRWGAIDKTGKMVIGPRFTGLSVFTCGIARALERGTRGYVNDRGHYLWREEYGPYDDWYSRWDPVTADEAPDWTPFYLWFALGGLLALWLPAPWPPDRAVKRVVDVGLASRALGCWMVSLTTAPWIASWAGSVLDHDIELPEAWTPGFHTFAVVISLALAGVIAWASRRAACRPAKPWAARILLVVLLYPVLLAIGHLGYWWLTDFPFSSGRFLVWPPVVGLCTVWLAFALATRSRRRVGYVIGLGVPLVGAVLARAGLVKPVFDVGIVYWLAVVAMVALVSVCFHRLVSCRKTLAPAETNEPGT